MALSSSSSVPQIPIVVSPPSPYGETEPIRHVLLLAAIGLLRARAVLLLSAIVFAIGGVLLARREPTMFTAQSTFIIQEGAVAAPTPFSALMGGGTAANSQLEYYDALLRTRALLTTAVDTTYAISADGGTRVQPLNVKDSSGLAPAISLAAAAGQLATRVSLSQGKAGIIALNVKAAHPYLAKQLNDRMLELLNRFNYERKRSRVVTERRFVERRLEEVSVELRDAEERWMDFQRRNRNIGSSPELMFEQQRLQRMVDMKQGLVNQLTQNMEQARIEEVRDTPVLTIFEPSLEPGEPDPNPAKGYLVFGAVLGLFLAGAFAILRELATRWSRPADELHGELRRLAREAMGDFRRPWRPFARLIGARR